MGVSLRRRLLVHLADEGVVEHPAGRVTSLLAEQLGTTASRVAEVLRRAADAGQVEMRRNTITGRIFRVTLTPTGRAEVGRETFTHSAAKTRPEPPATPPPPMPVLGPIGRHRFDPAAARERAGMAAAQ